MTRKTRHAKAEERPTEKSRHVGCMSGFFHLLERAHQKRITAAADRRSPKKSSPSGREGKEASHANNTLALTKPVDFRDVVRESLHKDRSPKTPPPNLTKEILSANNIANQKLSSNSGSDKEVLSTNNIFLESKETLKEVSLGSKEILVRKQDEIIPSEISKMSSKISMLRDSPRFSCDGREISRSSSPMDLNREHVLRCSSLKIRDSSPSRIDTPKRSPGLVARLMGLDDIPGSSSLQETTNLQDEEESFNEESPYLATVQTLEKRQRLISELESCDRDLQALKRIVETLQLKEAYQSSNNSSGTNNTTPPIVIIKPGRLPQENSKAPMWDQVHKKNQSRNGGEIHSVGDDGKVKCESGSEYEKNDMVFQYNSENYIHLNKNSSKDCRKKAINDIRVEPKNKGNKNEVAYTSASKARNFNLEQSRVKRSLDFCGDLPKVVKEKTKSKTQSACEVEVPSEITSDGHEQPSPVSVLDSSFYNEDTSPVQSKNVDEFREIDIYKFENLSQEGSNVECETPETYTLGDSAKESVNAIQTPPIPTINEMGNELMPQALAKTTWESCEILVSDIFEKSGLLQEGISNIAIQISSSNDTPLLISQEILDNVEDKNTKYELANSLSKQDKKLVFDMINEILKTRFSAPWWIQGRQCMKTGDQIMKQVISEFQRIKGFNINSNKADDDMCNSLLKLIERDLIRDGWKKTIEVEQESVVNDVERLVFKELMDEFISDVMFFSYRAHRRRLFFF